MKYLAEAHEIEDATFKNTIARYKASMSQSQ
jgi:hypothetical protein